MVNYKRYKVIFCLLLCCILQISCASTAPLPSTLNIVPPSPNVPPEIAAFSGVWEGIWDISAADIFLVIEKIDSQKAEVILSIGDVGYYAANYSFHTATLKSGPSIEWIEDNGDKFIFTISRELDEIKGVFIEQKTGSKSIATLHKRNTPVSSESMLVELCYDYTARKKYDMAIDECTKEIDSGNSSAATYLNLAAAYMTKEQYHNAIETLDKAIKVIPSFDMAYNNRGFIHLIQGRFSEAELDIRKAIELNPDNIHANMSMAEFYSLTNKNDFACKWLTTSIKEGWSDWNYIQTHKNFDNIRNEECYKAIIKGK